ncbi:MAG: hypothetical protein WD801_10170 [Gemmatimonadaceae bacterium]
MNATNLALGQRVPSMSLTCADSLPRTIAAPGTSQLVTFATVSDCAACEAHMSGLETLAKAGALPVETMVVFWAPRADVARALRLMRSSIARPLCRDEHDSLWIRLDITHTPVTALIRDGRIALLDDGPLFSPVEQRLFADRVRRLSVDR